MVYTQLRNSKRLRTFCLVFTVALLMMAVILPQQQAKAFATATSTTFGCSSFSASGTTDAPYVTIYAYAGGVDYFTIVANNGGTYSGSVSFSGTTDWNGIEL
ncbi:MAG: hypothetical protein U0528_00430 [Anaerolineae bacterium]